MCGVLFQFWSHNSNSTKKAVKGAAISDQVYAHIHVLKWTLTEIGWLFSLLLFLFVIHVFFFLSWPVNYTASKKFNTET